MSSFQFDLLGERLLVDSVTTYIQLAQAAAGVFDIGQVRSDKPETRVAKNGKTEIRKPQPAATPSPNQTYATVEDMQDLLGREALAELSQDGPPRPGIQRHRHIGAMIEARSRLLTEELIGIRKRFYPNHDIADVGTGTPEFKAAVDASVAYYFPPLVSPAQLLTDLPRALQEIGYRSCAASAIDGGTLAELNAWTDYFDFYSEHLAIEGAPPAPTKNCRTPETVRQYLLALRPILTSRVADDLAAAKGKFIHALDHAINALRDNPKQVLFELEPAFNYGLGARKVNGFAAISGASTGRAVFDEEQGDIHHIVEWKNGQPESKPAPDRILVVNHPDPAIEPVRWKIWNVNAARDTEQQQGKIDRTIEHLLAWRVLAKPEVTAAEAGAAAKDAAAPSKGEPPKALYSFKFVGNIWEIYFDGEHGKFTDQAGWRSIAKLLRSPDTQISALELMETRAADRQVTPPSKDEATDDERPARSEHTQQEVADRRAIDDVKKLLKETYPADLAAAEEERNATKIREVKEYMRIAQEYLDSATGFGGKPRKFKSKSPANSARASVSANMKRVRDHLLKATPPLAKLAEHLKASIDPAGTAYAYRPQQSIDWQL